MLPAAARLPEALPLIEGWQYFIVHAPRQTGKTTTLAALAAQLTADGRHVALRLSCERAEAWGDDIEAAELAVLDAIRGEATARQLPSEFLPPDPWPDASRRSTALRGAAGLGSGLPAAACAVLRRVDALRGQSLISVLRQLRDPRVHHPPAGVSRLRRAVRAARHPGLQGRRPRRPEPARHRQPVQCRRRIAANRRLHRRRGSGPLPAAHRRDRPGVHSRRGQAGLRPDPGPALAGQRPGPRGHPEDGDQPPSPVTADHLETPRSG